MTIRTIETDSAIYSYDDTPELRSAVFNRVMDYFKEHNAFYGECIHQSDNPIIDAPSVMSDITDKIIRFKRQDKP